jgi:hypothetical protein
MPEAVPLKLSFVTRTLFFRHLFRPIFLHPKFIILHYLLEPRMT